MARPDGDLAMLPDSTARLLATSARLGDDDVRAPSLLPGWTVGHVLTHLARNADSHVRRLEAAVVGEVVPQYAGGRAERDADIDAGAGRPAAEIVVDLQMASYRLWDVLASVPEEVWDRAVVEREHFTAPAHTLPFTRLMEMEVHHADLGEGYGPADWPLPFVDRALVATMDRIERRGEGVAGPPASWHLHRTDGDGEWVVRRDPSRSTVTAEHVKADCAVRGPGRGLLVWLLGRAQAQEAGLDVLGDGALAAQLPSVYAYG